MYDFVIRGVQIFDGSGESPFLGDVAVEGRNIASVRFSHETPPLEAANEVDGERLALAPGFIDVHSHDDFAAFLQPELPWKLLQGVTTEVVGNCGIGAAPWPGAEDWFEKLHPEAARPDYEDYRGYFQRLEEAAPSLNVAALAGHGALRRSAAPHASRLLDRREMSGMLERVDEAAEAGVFGLSAGLIYEPGIHADAQELIQAAAHMRQRAPLFAVHLRSEADDLLPAVEEALHISEVAEVGLQLSHHKAHGRNNWGRVDDSLALVEGAREGGRDVWIDQYPYTAGSTLLSAVMERGGLSGGRALGVLKPADIVIASAPQLPHFEGRSLEELAQDLGVTAQKAAEKVLVEEPGAWVVVHAMSERDVRKVMSHPATLIGSDGLPTATGRPHPRLWGTFPRILGHYCRQEEVLGLAQAIAKMTRLAAERFGLKGRGRIERGYAADLVLFDPGQVAAGSTFEQPLEAPRGIVKVWVNGTETVSHGTHTKARAGGPLRRAL